LDSLEYSYPNDLMYLDNKIQLWIKQVRKNKLLLDH